MRKSLRICFLILTLILSLLGWKESRAAVILLWALLCIEELVSLQLQENRSPVWWYRWYKPLLLAGCVLFTGFAIWLVLSGS